MSSRLSSPTLPSSPPEVEMADDKDYDPVSERMRLEEKKAREETRKLERKEKERAKKEWRDADEGKVDKQFAKLHYLLDRSKVWKRRSILENSAC